MQEGEKPDALAEIEAALRGAMALDLLGHLTVQHVAQLERALSLLPRLREVIRACEQEHGGKYHEPECPICVALMAYNAQAGE